MTEAGVAPRFHSGIQISEQSGATDYAVGEIRAANETLLQRTGLQLELPIAALAEQRDNALRWYVYERTKGEQAQVEHQRELDAAAQSHQSDLEALAQQHRAALDALRAQLSAATASRAPTAAPSAAAAVRGTLMSTSGEGSESRVKVSIPGSSAVEAAAMRPSVEPRPGGSNLLGELVVDDFRARVTELELRNSELDALLKAATVEAEETRRDAMHAERERDEALTAADDTRLQMQTDLDAARDEISAIEAQLDEVRRDGLEARDRAQLEIMRLNEELAEVRESLAKCLGG